jgi:hypothetical protein
VAVIQRKEGRKERERDERREDDMIWLIMLFLGQSFAWIDTGPCDSLFNNEACATNEISFKRVRYIDDSQRSVAIFLYVQSGDMTFMNTKLVFTDENPHFHNTLMINPQSFHKYEKIARTSDFTFNNEIILGARGRRLLLQYDIASPYNSSVYFSGSSNGQFYDAVILLDPYTSMWHEYNTLILEPLQVILRYENESLAVDNEDYAGRYQIQCNRSVSRKYCQINHGGGGGGDGLWINGVYYERYRVLIDPNQAINRLPSQLYMKWLYDDDHKRLSISVDNQSTLLMLNEQFIYELSDNTEGEEDMIIIGVDLMHYFQKVHYNLASQQYTLYYTHIYSRYTDHLLHIFLITYFVTTIMFHLFDWYTYSNYSVFEYILVYRDRLERLKQFPFDINQIYDELSSVTISLIHIIMTMIFTDPVSSVHFSYTHTTFQRRKILLYCYAFFNLLTAVTVLIMTREYTHRFLRYAYNWLVFTLGLDPRDQEYDYIKKMASQDTFKMNTKYVLVRNLTLHNLISLNMLFIFNYMAEENAVYGLLFILFNLAFIFWQVYYIHIDLLFLYRLLGGGGSNLWRSTLRRHSFFLLYILVNSIALVLYIGISLQISFINLLHRYNSIYPQSIIILSSLLLIVIIITIAFQAVDMTIKEAREEEEKETEEKEKEVTS